MSDPNPELVPERLRGRVALLPEVRMGVFLASVRLRDGRTVEPVIVNARPAFLGLAQAPDLASWEPLGFAPDDVVDLADASGYYDR